ncbi:MAG TPA: sigma-70 family RNA polymerase sigma factor [Pyrinomonadaceae bacterium]
MKPETKFLTDEELVEACRRGDEFAWEMIVSKYQNMLFSIPRRAGLGSDLASDVLQEVFKTLFEKLDSLEQPQFLRAWLTTTTRHKTIHLIQRETRGRPKSLDDMEEESHFEFPDKAMLPDEVLIQLEKENQIETALAQIGERCRRLITMLYLETEQIPYTDVARILEIPLGSIGPTRSRCLQKLIKLIPD